jgi:hypothetical protein
VFKGLDKALERLLNNLEKAFKMPFKDLVMAL